MTNEPAQRACFDAVVIGAGPAGLTAAYLLAKEGKSVFVAEKDPHYVGGISRTVDYNGYRFDIGGHRFFSKSREVVALWNELLPDDFITCRRMSRIYYDGKFYSYPLRAFEALSNLGLLRSTKCMLSYARWRLWPHQDPRTFEQWVTNHFGAELFSIFFETYTEKVWGMPCDQISADWAAQRIKGLDLMTAVLDGLKRSLAGAHDNNGMRAKTLLESFRYPRKGPGMMWEAARDRILALGGQVEMDAGLARASFDEPSRSWRIELADHSGRISRTIHAAHLISSAPMRELAEILYPRAASFGHAAALRYRDFLTVALILRKKDRFPDNWIYVHDPSVRVGRIQNFRAWSEDMVPDGETTCVGLEYFCFEGDELWTSSDRDLIALAAREFAQLGLAAEADVVDGCVVRQEKAYPVYDEDHQKNVDAVRMELERLYPTLHLVGRNGMHKYNNQDHAMMTAMLTVRNILAGRRKYNVWSVNEDAEYLERGSEGEVDALRSERLVPRRAPKPEPVALSARFVRALGADRLGYLCVSIAAVAADFILTLQLTWMGLAPALSAALGYALGMALHWELSTRLVFSGELAEAGPHRARQAALFVASGVAGLGVTMAVYAGGIAMGATAPLAKLLAIGLSFIAVYILRRHLVFPLRT